MQLAKSAFLIGTLFACGALLQAAPQQGTTSGENPGSLAPGMTISATLKSSIDSKKAKVGETVTAETTEAVKSADGHVILPRGSQIIGHIVQATVRSKGEGQSVLAIKFDKAESKDGQEVQLGHLVLQAIAAPAQENSNFGSFPDNTGSSGPSRSNNPSMSGSNSPMPGARNTGSNPSNPYPGTPTGSEPGGTGGTSSGVAGMSSGPLPANSRGVYGLHGLRLGHMNSPNGEAAVIESTQKSVHLDSGTRLLLVEQPSGENETFFPTPPGEHCFRICAFQSLYT